MIHVTVNGEPKSLQAATLLLDALNGWDINDSSVAIAINEAFVPRSAYTQTMLTDGDRLEVLAPMQGG